MSPALRASGRTVVAIASVAALAGTTFVAGRASVEQVSAASRPGAVATQNPLWTVKSEQVGRSITLDGTLTRPQTPAPVLASQGVVTSLDAGGPVTQGSVLATVNLRPVVAGRGTVPAFRTLAKGVEGEDVQQLRRMLCDLKVESRCTSPMFDDELEATVARWNKGRGVGDEGRVELGDVVWFAVLPAGLRPAEGIAVGARVEPGQQVFTMVGQEVVLDLPVSKDQAALVPVGSLVTVEGIKGRVAEVVPSGDHANLRVTDREGHALCAAQDCAALLGSAASKDVAVQVDVVPVASGLAVPVKALRTDAAGDTQVVDEAGAAHAVTVTQQAGGMALCDGLRAGMKVRLDQAQERP